MWLSRQMKREQPAAEADLGMTTIGGGSAGVLTRGEVRSLPVYGPGGYVWLPEAGNAVLVIKGGPGGEEQCVAGVQQCAAPKDMLPGEVFVYGPAGNAVYLKRDGTVELKGKVSVRGELTVNGRQYEPCTCGEEL